MHKIAQIPKIIIPSSESKSKQRKDSDLATASHTNRPLAYLTVPSGQSGTNSDQQIPTNISNNLFSGQQLNNQTSGGGLRGVFTRIVSGNWAG